MAAHSAHRLTFGAADATPALRKLCSVAVTHTFYLPPLHACADLSVEATPACQALMAQLGIALRRDATGFSLFIQTAKLPALQAYLLDGARVGPDGQLEFWQRLTFSLRLNNPDFVGFTSLPLDLVTSSRNLYASNSDAHHTDQGLLLSAGAAMLGDALLRVTGPELPVTLPEDVAAVQVEDISGTVVLPAPDAKPIYISPPPYRQALLELGSLPHGRYRIVALTDARRACGGDGYPRDVLYTPQQSDALVLLDLFFTRPTRGSAGKYPFERPDSPPAGVTVQPIDLPYLLPFITRFTQWRYFVTSLDPGTRLADLRIDGEGITFSGPGKPVPLPSGRSAVVFTADCLLPLQHKPTLLFKLHGKRLHSDSHENHVRISRLPAASSTPVWPDGELPPVSGVSEIFVYV